MQFIKVHIRARIFSTFGRVSFLRPIFLWLTTRKARTKKKKKRWKTIWRNEELNWGRKGKKILERKEIWGRSTTFSRESYATWGRYSWGAEKMSIASGGLIRPQGQKWGHQEWGSQGNTTGYQFGALRDYPPPVRPDCRNLILSKPDFLNPWWTRLIPSRGKAIPLWTQVTASRLSNVLYDFHSHCLAFNQKITRLAKKERKKPHKNY